MRNVGWIPCRNYRFLLANNSFKKIKGNFGFITCELESHASLDFMKCPLLTWQGESVCVFSFFMTGWWWSLNKKGTVSNQFEKDSHQKSAAALDDKATQWGRQRKKSETKLFCCGDRRRSCFKYCDWLKMSNVAKISRLCQLDHNMTREHKKPELSWRLIGTNWSARCKMLKLSKHLILDKTIRQR